MPEPGYLELWVSISQPMRAASISTNRDNDQKPRQTVYGDHDSQSFHNLTKSSALTEVGLGSIGMKPIGVVSGNISLTLLR